MTDDSGWLWILMSVGMVAALGLGLIYGVVRSRRTTPRQEAAGDRKAEQLAKQRDPDEG